MPECRECDRQILDREARRVENRDIVIGAAPLGRSCQDISQLGHVVAPEEPRFDRVHEVAVVACLLIVMDKQNTFRVC